MNKEIQAGKHIYRIGQLSAMDQFHLSRRLAPIIPTVGPVLAIMPKILTAKVTSKPEMSSGHDMDSDGSETTSLASAPSLSDLVEILPSLQSFADAIADLPDDQAEYVINTCLSVASRKTGTGWAAVRLHGQTMLDDLTLQEMMQITIAAIQVNLGPFIKGLLTKENEQPQTQDLPA